MRNETDKSVSFPDQGNLLLPEINRIVIQYLEQRIVLASGQRNLQYLADKVRKDCTAAAALRFQVRYVWHGHVVGKLVGVVPIEIAIHDSRAEALRAEFLDVLVDFPG